MHIHFDQKQLLTANSALLDLLEKIKAETAHKLKNDTDLLNSYFRKITIAQKDYENVSLFLFLTDSWQPNAFLERATIEDTTVTYALVNPKTKRFTSQTAKKTEYRKATHYDNDSYILEKAYYCFEHNLPSYKENA